MSRFVFYAAQRSDFMWWFLPIGFTILSAMLFWREPRWTWFATIAALLAIGEWARFIKWRRRRTTRGLANG